MIREGSLTGLASGLYLYIIFLRVSLYPLR